MQDLLHSLPGQPLTNSLVLEIAGTDASRVLNNLTTNDLSKLRDGEQLETFITDVRGWTVAHGFARNLPGRTVFVGQHPNPTTVCNHINRYIIREDAVVTDLSDSHGLFLVEQATALDQTQRSGDNPNDDFVTIAASITGPDNCLVVAPSDAIKTLVPTAIDKLKFNLARIKNFWPVMGQDILEKCIPQELDRDERTISFTKGCYLGQETIARLDARGQLQKKLCLLEFTIDSGTHPLAVSAKLDSDGKEVGQITSIAQDEACQKFFALAFVKREYFEAGSTIRCGNCLGTVLPPPGS
jgi:tRNA-modifying protein YgfZ